VAQATRAQTTNRGAPIKLTQADQSELVEILTRASGILIELGEVLSGLVGKWSGAE